MGISSMRPRLNSRSSSPAIFIPDPSSNRARAVWNNHMAAVLVILILFDIMSSFINMSRSEILGSFAGLFNMRSSPQYLFYI
ncbi:MAG: hypothetical protein [Cressdnaviricota sp.]|nr:MAG: hypothetical protein [Cressdnaviricota sp.]